MSKRHKTQYHVKLPPILVMPKPNQGCATGKRCFLSQEACFVSIVNQYHRGNVSNAEQPIMPYLCPHCHYWHKTSHLAGRKSAQKDRPRRMVIQQAPVDKTWNLKCPCCLRSWGSSSFEGALAIFINHVQVHKRSKK